MKKVYAECAIIAGCAVIFTACLYLGTYVGMVHSYAWYCYPTVILCTVGLCISGTVIIARLEKQEVKK